MDNKNLEDIKVLSEDVMKIDVEDEDVLLVTLPKHVSSFSPEQQQEYTKSVSDAFQAVFKEKNIKVVVVPQGMTVKVIRNSDLQDNDGF